ncbi:MAG: hypothetical protein ABIU20_07835 [Blastocatellia bacterium]
MTTQEIEKYLSELSDELSGMGVKGEICLYGGAVMCLVYQARPSTKDVDAVFQPTSQMRAAAQRVAQAHGLRDDWLNDAVKGFVVEHLQRILFDFPALKVYVPEPDYLLAMKTLAARVDASDKDDIMFLLKLLKLQTANEVFAILEKYYPRQRIKPATQFFVEELFEPDGAMETNDADAQTS